MVREDLAPHFFGVAQDHGRKLGLRIVVSGGRRANRAVRAVVDTDVVGEVPSGQHAEEQHQDDTADPADRKAESYAAAILDIAAPFTSLPSHGVTASMTEAGFRLLALGSSMWTSTEGNTSEVQSQEP